MLGGERDFFLVGINSAHWHPNVLALRRMIEELTALALFIVGPVTGQTIVHPGPFDILRRGVLDELGALGRAKVPGGLDVLMLDQCLHQVIARSGQDVDDAGWQVGCFKDLLTF